MTLEFLFYPKLYKAQPRVDENSCGAVAEDSAKTAQWAVFSSAARESTRAHQELQYPNRVLEFLFCSRFFRAGHLRTILFYKAGPLHEIVCSGPVVILSQFLSQFSKIVPIKTAYLRYAVCGCFSVPAGLQRSLPWHRRCGQMRRRPAWQSGSRRPFLHSAGLRRFPATSSR